MGDAANANANPNGALNGRAVFCPSCGAADVEASGLAGGAAKCNVCTWTGKVEDLAVFLFSHDMGTPEEVFRAFFLDVRKLLGSEFAQGVMILLVKWGFLPPVTPRTTDRQRKAISKNLARYLGAASLAMTQSILKTRAVIEKEEHSEPPAAG